MPGWTAAKTKMEKTVFPFFIICLGLIILMGALRGIDSASEETGTVDEVQTGRARICASQCQLLADRTETKDRIIYGTDHDMERAMEDQERIEKEKEENAWRMLQNMNIYKESRRKSPRHRPKVDPQD